MQSSFRISLLLFLILPSVTILFACKNPLGSQSGGELTPTVIPTATPIPDNYTVPGNILVNDNFDNYANTSAVQSSGWDLTYTTLESGAECRSGKCLKVSLPGSGTHWYISHQITGSNLYVRFSAKRTNFNGSGGNKILKLFGGSGTNYANTTFSQEYVNGQFYAVKTGEGLGSENDTQCNWYWGTHTPQTAAGCTGTPLLHKGTLDMVEGRWYDFVMHSKRNSNGTADGEIDVWLDGVHQLSYSNVKFRNDLNPSEFSSFSFVNSAYNLTAPYEMWIDDVKVGASLSEVAPSYAGN